MKLNKKGFTLVELLAVIVILALLMVVSARSIGSSLTNSKRSALQTEVQKVVTKVYEEAKTQTLQGTLKDTEVKFSNATYDSTNNVVTVTEGDYKVYILLSSFTDNVTVSAYCAQGSGMSVGQTLDGTTPTLSFASDFWDNAGTAVTADTAVGSTMQRGTSCSVTGATIKIVK